MDHSFDLENLSHWTITRVVIAQAEKLKQKTAIEFIDGAVWSYSDCEYHARVAAAGLRDSGVTKGDRIALMIDSPEDFCRFWLGLNFIGATMVAINTGMRGTTLKHQLDVSDCRLVIADHPHIGECKNCICDASVLTVDEVRSDTVLADHEIVDNKVSHLSCIMFTSGTSGPSKGVLMPQAHCLLFAVGTIENYQLAPDDSFYICLPLFHANGLFMQLLACLTVGCKAVVRKKFSASNWLDDIRRHRITHTNTLGAVAAFIVAQPETPRDQDHQLKVIGAAPLPATAEQAFRSRFGIPAVVPLYGMTEVNIPLYGKLDESAPGTCGHVYSKYFEVEIRNPDTDEIVADGDPGEIMVRPKIPYGFMAGYAGMDEETLNAWRNFWFHTGDAGYRNAQGQFVFIDRIKDCIRKRGENISSYEVEQAFLTVEDVAEVAAYAVPAEGGEGMEDEVMIAVMLKNGNGIKDKTTGAIDQWLAIDLWLAQAQENLPPFALPRYVRIVDQLPKTQTGKIRKTVLREEGVTADTQDRRTSNG